MIKVSIEAAVRMELSGERPAGYVEELRRAAVGEERSKLLFTRTGLDDLLRKYDQVRLLNRRKPMPVPAGYDPRDYHLDSRGTEPCNC